MLSIYLPMPACLAILFPVLAGGASNLAAQEQRPTPLVTVTGQVVDRASGEPVPGVAVVVEELDLRLETDAEGKFLLAQIQADVYEIHLVHRDYERLVGDLTIDRSGDFVLGMSPAQYLEDALITGIIGVVTDQVSGNPIPEVVVNIPLVGRVARTDIEGRFRLDELLPGRHAVEFTHLGYLPRVDSVDVASRQVTRVHTVLAVEPIALNPLEVTVERRNATLQDVGFYEREEDGWGHFLDPEDIEAWASIRLTDAFTRFVGVSLVHDGTNPFRRYVVLRRSGGNCYPAVYLDGLLMSRGGDGPGGIDELVPPQAVAGVEIYRGSAGIPPQYWGVNSSCGVVLIWTRRG